MLKRTVALTSLIALGAIGVAQAADPVAVPAPRATTSAVAPSTATTTDSDKLIGRNIQNAQNDTIGEIKSVRIGADGKVDAVIVGVGGFLGMGEREVALNWTDLKIMDGGTKVTVPMTKEQLKALPEYKYPDASYRGRTFSENARPATAMGTTSRDRAATIDARDGDFNTKGQISGSALIGATIRNAANESIGEVKDVFLDQNGTVKALVVSVGGAMGIGAKSVMLPWQDLKVDRQQNKLFMTTNATKETLKAMPEYKG